MLAPIRKRIGEIFVYKRCFCYLNVQNVKQKNYLFYQPIVLITIGDVTDIFAIVRSNLLMMLHQISDTILKLFKAGSLWPLESMKMSRRS